MSKPGACIIIGLAKGIIPNPHLPTKRLDTKEWEAPESNRTKAGTELTGNVPKTTSGAAWASSARWDEGHAGTEATAGDEGADYEDQGEMDAMFDAWDE